MSKVANFKSYRDLCIEILNKEKFARGDKKTVKECVDNMSNEDLTEYNLITDKRKKEFHCIMYKLIDRGLIKTAAYIINKRPEMNMHNDKMLTYACNNCNYLKLIQRIVNHPNTVIYTVYHNYDGIDSNICNYSKNKEILEIIFKSKKISKSDKMREYRLNQQFYGKIGINPMNY